MLEQKRRYRLSDAALQLEAMIRLNYNIITNAVRGPTHQRERKEGRNKGEQQRGKGKDEGLDRQREEVTVVYILKAEGKLLNYR